MIIEIESLNDGSSRIKEKGFVKHNPLNGGIYFSDNEILDIIGHSNFTEYRRGKRTFEIKKKI